MKILVTGAAGFIGFHVSKLLIKNNFDVVGLDNINDYYDIQLKYDRLKNLGIQTFSIYALTIILIHNSFFFLLENFSSSFLLLLRIISSTVVTFIIILIFQLFTFKTKE